MAGVAYLQKFAPGSSDSAAAHIAVRNRSLQEAQAEQLFKRIAMASLPKSGATRANASPQSSASTPMGRWGRAPATGDPLPQVQPHDETIFEHYTGIPDEYRVDAINAIAGWQDAVSFGLADDVRSILGLNKDVHKDTASYAVGEAAGIGTSILFGGAQGLRAAGVKARGMEFSHWIPNRMGGPRSLWNGNYVPKEVHALSDPYRYRFMPKVWKQLNKMPNRAVQQWVRIPNVYKGAAGGGALSAAGAESVKLKGW